MEQFYEPTGFAFEIFSNRYALHKNESWVEACERVASHVAMAEQGENVPLYKDAFTSLLRKNTFMPGGRIWYGAGRPKGQLLNCFVIPTADSREGWGKSVSDMIIVCGSGGGLGLNASPIRPRGSSINGSGGYATGAVSLMEIVNAAGTVMEAGGGRRTALMFCLNINHGDIEEFLDKKLDLKTLNSANVSVVFNDNPEEFFKKVKNDLDLELMFRGNVIGSIPAKKIWNKIVSNALKGGEPGVLNGYLANKMSNVWYLYSLISTNPCGEIWLPAYGSCCLGSLVLPRFVDEEKMELDWDAMEKTIHLSVRFLDNVLTVNNYPLPEIKEVSTGERRVGLGVMGLSSMLLMLGLKYGSDEAIEHVDHMMNWIKNRAYEASVELAKEKGSFPKFDAEQYLKGGFAKTLKPSIRSAIRQHGMRNCALLTNAPTGTTSIVSNVDSGIEPSFGPAWLRRYQDNGVLKKEVIVHPLLKKFMQLDRDVSHFQPAYELTLRDHFEMQRACQRHVDNAVSKTINIAKNMNVTEERLSELYMEFLPDLKGVTVYPDNSREDQPITPLSLEEALKHVDDDKEMEGAMSDDSCRGGVCDVPWTKK